MRTLNKLVLDGLMHIKADGPCDRSFGICYSLSEYIRNSEEGLEDIQAYWKVGDACKALGYDATSPVETALKIRHKSDHYPSFNGNINLWSMDCEGGRRRWQLLDELIDYYEIVVYWESIGNG